MEWTEITLYMYTSCRPELSNELAISVVTLAILQTNFKQCILCHNFQDEMENADAVFAEDLLSPDANGTNGENDDVGVHENGQYLSCCLI